jgi:hypothetical protein
MNDVEPDGVTTDTDSTEQPSPAAPRRRPAITLLTAAPSLALAALAAAPLTAAVRLASHFGDSQTLAVIGDECNRALATGALHTLKWPDCAGD